MRITRLHIILILAVLFLSGVLVIQIQQKKIAEKERFELINKQREAEQKRFEQESKLRLEAELKEKQCLENKKQLAIEAVAVAGEYMIINKKEKKDIKAGRAVLVKAKECLAVNDFEQAWQLAHQSIKEFKAAKGSAGSGCNAGKARIYYKVKRGDCLWKIAKMPRHYNDGSKWVRIWRANKKKIHNYRLIYPRQVFYIPKSVQ